MCACACVDGGGCSDLQTDLLKLQTEYFWQLPRRQSSPSLILLTETRRGARKRRRRREEGEQEQRKRRVGEREGPVCTDRERLGAEREGGEGVGGQRPGRKRELLLLHLCVFHE